MLSLRLNCALFCARIQFLRVNICCLDQRQEKVFFFFLQLDPVSCHLVNCRIFF